MDLILTRLGWLLVDDNLLDDEAHTGEAGRLRGGAPHGVAEDVVNPAYQADEIVNGRLRVRASHLLVEPALHREIKQYKMLSSMHEYKLMKRR